MESARQYLSLSPYGGAIPHLSDIALRWGRGARQPFLDYRRFTRPQPPNTPTQLILKLSRRASPRYTRNPLPDTPIHFIQLLHLAEGIRYTAGYMCLSVQSPGELLFFRLKGRNLELLLNKEL
eukprot:sb/3475865/